MAPINLTRRAALRTLAAGAIAGLAAGSAMAAILPAADVAPAHIHPFVADRWHTYSADLRQFWTTLFDRPEKEWRSAIARIQETYDIDGNRI